MKKSQIAAQLYTLRDFLKTPEDIAKSLAKVRQIGYEAVQISGMGEISTSELNKILANEGLVNCATHESGKSIVEETDKVIARLQELNCKFTAYPYPHQVPANYDEAVALAKQLNTAAEKMAAAGQVLCYHNHAIEFRRFDGKLMLDIFYDNAPAMYSELDTYWVQSGGCCPTQWVKKMAGRLPLLHLKDFMIGEDNKGTMAAIGAGNLDWPSIIAAAEAGGTEWYIVEQDVCPKDPFECLADSFKFINDNFVK